MKETPEIISVACYKPTAVGAPTKTCPLSPFLTGRMFGQFDEV